jgi:hypothetical protein
VRFSRAEHARLVERARVCHRSLNAFVRIAALGRRMPEPPMPAINLATVGELNRIGNNLNQAVHLLHIGHLSGDFAQALADLERLIKSLKRQLLKCPDEDAEERPAAPAEFDE